VCLGNVFHVIEIEGVEPYLKKSNAFFSVRAGAPYVEAIVSYIAL
jgi:hypothetical protein